MYTFVPHHNNTQRNESSKLTFSSLMREESCIVSNGCPSASHPPGGPPPPRLSESRLSWWYSYPRLPSWDTQVFCKGYHFCLLQAQNIRVVTDFSSHISCHLNLPNPALMSPSAVSSSPLIQILFLFIPVNSAWFSVFEFPCHLYIARICCFEITSCCFICIFFMRFKVFKAEVKNYWSSSLCKTPIEPLASHYALFPSLPSGDNSICLSLLSKVWRRSNN